MNVCMYVYMYVCMFACMYVCMYVCMYSTRNNFVLLSSNFSRKNHYSNRELGRIL